MRSRCLVFVLIFLLSTACFAQPIGTWQDHLSYQSAIAVGTGDSKLVVASPWALFTYDPQNETFSRFSKINGLSESGIETIYIDGSLTIIAYSNGQIDLLEDGKTRTVNTLRLSNIAADKKVNAIWKENDRCLLATGFGIAVLNIEKAEIGDVYLIANGGVYSKINSIAASTGYYYAAGEQGLYRASRSATNLADFRNWTLLSGLPAGAVQKVLVWRNELYVQIGNQLFKEEAGGFNSIYQDNWQWQEVDTSSSEILLAQRTNGAARVQLINNTGQVQTTLTHPLIQWPYQTVYFQEQYWVADSLNGLINYDGNFVDRLYPNSPAGIGTGGLVAGASGWWMANENRLSRFLDGNWQLSSTFEAIGPLLETGDGGLWVGSRNAGLGLLREGNLQVFREELLGESVQEPEGYKVGGLALDAAGQLWISNDEAARGLVVRRPDGTHQSFEIPFFYPSLRVKEIVIDELDQKWIASPGNGLFCLNATNEQWRFFQAGTGNGNLPSNEVLSLARDQFGFIWIGTADGIGIIQCASQVFSGDACEAILPVVQSDNFAGFLFKGEAVQTIAVDGANRKWIGTKNGAWLISAGGEQTLLRFTTANSPLPDNDIRKIAIDPTTGAVLISTAKGLMSYQSTATEGGRTNTNVLVYPNPVPPGYTGTIAIRGLVNNAVVKITELNGRLIYQGRALGGQFIWNGLDLNGKKVATGVYPVWISNDGRTEQAVTKIVFIQQ
ncbi:two-component regulator propeller domain-containing protein [Flavihumibacter cheonanensis]|uniref:type IX secretion system anionic LPS delivery protein PorZ n=1 Tax=Flavihumibacter cheonanensis TaxID=1442385 RepID=UPI001EF8ACD9|nr:two-component regulator propeller domain-containing protein [Flavihumibacter cheonanensis]MCG7753432.1 hypothetical protein [Flavihumibacter cheonanensis]